MKKVFIVSLCLLILAVTLGTFAAEMFRQCPNCAQVAYNDWWKFCPRCGCKLDASTAQGTAAGIPVDAGYDIINNTYRNLPHLFRIERPGEIWTFVHGDKLRRNNPQAVVEVALPQTSVGVSVRVHDEKEMDLATFFKKKIIFGKAYKDVKVLSKDTKTKHQGQPSIRQSILATVGDKKARFEILVIEKNDKKYMIYATGFEDDFKKFNDEIQKVINSFIFLKK